MSYSLMSTPSCSATSVTRASGRTLKPMITASEAEASITSVSVIVPVELWMIFSLMSSVLSLFSASIRASMEP